MDAGDALDQGALAGAVVADEGGDLAGADVQVDAPQDVHGAEALVDAPQLEQRGGASELVSASCTVLVVIDASTVGWSRGPIRLSIS